MGGRGIQGKIATLAHKASRGLRFPLPPRIAECNLTRAGQLGSVKSRVGFGMKWGAVTGGVLAALASLPIASPTRAADMTPIGQPAIPAPAGYIPAQFLWTGFYMGAGIGGGFGTSTFFDPFPAAAGVIASPSLRGFLVSGIAGINYQISSVVIGVEGDFTGSWAKGSVVDSAGNTLLTSVFWTSTFAGRLGLAFDRLLIYGRGGAAFDYDRDTATLPGTASAVGSLYRTAGWTVGGGVEYAVTEHWTGRIEYDYLRFPAKALGFQGNALPPVGFFGVPGTATGAVGLSIGEIKGIMAYKF
jgi:outer membrane immunogenic protein